MSAGGGSRTQTDTSLAAENQSPPSVEQPTREHPSTRSDVERRPPDQLPDQDRKRVHGATIVARLAVGELERERVESARKLLAAALAMLDDEAP